MEVINRTTPELVLFGGRARTRVYVNLSTKGLYFTSAASRLCGFNENLFVHFLNDGKDWNFFLDDNTDGFPVSFIVAKNSYELYNSGLAGMMLKSMGFKGTKRLSVEKTKIIHDKCNVFKLSLENISSAER